MLRRDSTFYFPLRHYLTHTRLPREEYHLRVDVIVPKPRCAVLLYSSARKSPLEAVSAAGTTLSTQQDLYLRSTLLFALYQGFAGNPGNNSMSMVLSPTVFIATSSCPWSSVVDPIRYFWSPFIAGGHSCCLRNFYTHVRRVPYTRQTNEVIAANLLKYVLHPWSGRAACNA